ncbi:HU family DNA-binding protein [Virgibacillus sp. M23]|uniref:HU family DNA-binding protein n=1 Tax=Virgibacillus sp. M23 TaxID=3079030 RepID=UPI002A90F378|nr:HU family DNA-binding protein [Virgibacillus sp. M23]MDY7043674.1 HU family DNA-binding protein [Virgibacillus sp. M23]
MKTQDVVNRIAEITGGTKKEAKQYLGAFKQVVVEGLESGEGVSLKGFVEFSVKEVPAHEARNPQTGESVQVPAHRKGTAKLSNSIKKY